MIEVDRSLRFFFFFFFFFLVKRFISLSIHTSYHIEFPPPFDTTYLAIMQYENLVVRLLFLVVSAQLALCFDSSCFGNEEDDEGRNTIHSELKLEDSPEATCYDMGVKKLHNYFLIWDATKWLDATWHSKQPDQNFKEVSAQGCGEHGVGLHGGYHFAKDPEKEGRFAAVFWVEQGHQGNCVEYTIKYAPLSLPLYQYMKYI